mmetsp:Transcript_22788/g.68639  ORF Transcript_22788/g.68639 Transcript_22788/m.68639 type:complete len:347 (+) Transcript_22788:286-1326(+)
MKLSKSMPSFQELQRASEPTKSIFSRSSWRLLGLVSVWYASSVMQNIWGKSVLKKLPHPKTLTMAQFATINVVLPLLMSLWNKRRRKFDTRTYRTALIPLSLLKLLASVATFTTLLKVPVSYAHTVKALMPLFSVTLSRIVLGEHHSWWMMTTLIPIVVGVIISSVTELEFNLPGLLAALTSSLLLSSQTIFSKKAMLSVDHLNLLLVTSQISMALFTPYWVVSEGWSLFMGSGLAQLRLSTIELQQIMLQLLGASLLNATQTVSAFTFLSLVPPVTYSVANVTKRVAIISLSIVYFGQRATMANVLGMSTTFLGVGLYNYVKIKEREDKLFVLLTLLPAQCRAIA